MLKEFLTACLGYAGFMGIICLTGWLMALVPNAWPWFLVLGVVLFSMLCNYLYD